MANRIVIDPITRIEGHLRVEAEITEGKVTNAYVSSTMVRGMEKIVQNRDPRDVWAFVQRTCGVCTTVHAIASIRSVEDALDIVIPPNAEIARNIITVSHAMQDHVVHFYHLHALDWVDITQVLNADPKATSELAQSISKWPNSSPGYFSDVKTRIKKFVDSGQLGIFAKGYWGHKAMKLPAEVNLLAVAHYLEALEWQKEIVKVHTILGGKNPHPHFLVGGMASAINVNDAGGLNTERLAYVGQLLKDAHKFINEVYVPDLLAIASFYKDWGAIGGSKFNNYLSYGDLPTDHYRNPASFKWPQGVILNGDLSKVHEVDLENTGEIQEFVNKSWYNYKDGNEVGLHPYDGETDINYTGPKPPYDYLDVDKEYSFVKTPRWQGKPMEVGPLSRMLIGYAKGIPEYKNVVDGALKALDVPVSALLSTLGRTAARGLESKLLADWGLEFFDQLIGNIKNGDTRMANMEKWDPTTWPKEAKGVGYMEAPRGGLAHWIKIKDRKTENYQMVVPTTWNAGPRDPQGQMSAYESALIGTPIEDPENPVEILRTIHSFDPCLACAVHLYDEHGKHVSQVQLDGSCSI
ncbi:MAG: nickel-dependent hydrogenase large subunit [Lutibacter sp.]|uniref:nickel-dependent hydrogenase large subunit n=1 Tax=Lutibacter sp. TaxID=1925666 RepID=UPI0017AC433F|nr:nickel-dependent hydrogenase large subunit [Lutibacter sp.]MBT8316469.1 nickel-dependent hydrogenase large subunit [Lutibacter sp.]NNJ57329.1 nickel-dependent hydrogenase large subunit [Lutibacter sp.]